PAETKARSRAAQQLAWGGAELSEIRRLETPPRVWMSPEGPRSGARRIEQDDVHLASRLMTGVGNHGEDVVELETRDVLTHTAESRKGQVAREYSGGGAGQLDRLSAGGGADVGDDSAERHGGVDRHQCRRRILEMKQPLLECRQ